MSKEKREIFNTIAEGVDDHETREDHKEVIESIKKLVHQDGDPETFFSDHEYVESLDLNDLINEVSHYAYEFFDQKKYEEVIELCRATLEACGVEGSREASSQSASFAIAIAEATNWAAKTISYSFYNLKPLAIVSAAQIDEVRFGCDDDAYYLGNERVGVASFHDPDFEIDSLYSQATDSTVPHWSDEWSGVERQHDSFGILEDLTKNSGLVKAYADATSNEEMREIRRKFLEDNYKKRLANLGEILKVE